MAEESTRLDTDLLEGLTAKGFKIDRDDVSRMAIRTFVNWAADTISMSAARI